MKTKIQPTTKEEKRKSGKMKNICILVPKGAATLTCIEGSFFHL